MLKRAKRWIHAAERDVIAIGLAARDPRVPWVVKVLALMVLAYVLSPIDLIPDFIPVLGLLDDLLIVGLGVWLVIAMTPPGVMAEHREAAGKRRHKSRFAGRIGTAIIAAAWIALATLAGWLALDLLGT
jgi:uncharacterized membrane protein YkvA (DUF1232 family)